MLRSAAPTVLVPLLLAALATAPALARGPRAPRTAVVPPASLVARRVVLTAAEEWALDRSAAGLVPVRLAGGGERLHLAGRFQEAIVATRDQQGRSVLRCVHDAAALRGLLSAPAPPAPEER